MNILCNICSEIIVNDEDFAVTQCGHCFHRKCLNDWLRTSPTCPTCRHDASPSSLIKVYVENDQNKVNDLHNELIKSNEKLQEELKDVKTKAHKQEAELLEVTKKYRDTKESLTKLERTKQTDDMTITLLKSAKDDAVREIAKLNSQLNTLKLDLLAERQLRRLHQTTLHDLDSKNENYDIKTVDVEAPVCDQTANFKITPFWKLSSEPAAAESNPPKKETPYIIPSKIQKSNFDVNPTSMKVIIPKRNRMFKPVANNDQRNPPAEPQVSFAFSSSTNAPSLFRFGNSNDSSTTQQPSSSNQISSRTSIFSDKKKDFPYPRFSER